MEQSKQTEQTPQTPETEERTRYSVIAEQLIDAAKKSDPLERLEGMRHFVGELRQEAVGGYIKDSKGESYTPDVFDTQLLTFVDELNKPEDERKIKNPTMLIPRSEGLREAFMQLVSTESTAQPLLSAITEVKRGVEVQQVRERLTQTAHEVGGQALHALEVQDPFDQLSTHAQNEVLEYRQLVRNKIQAEKDKDFSLAAQDSRALYEARQ